MILLIVTQLRFENFEPGQVIIAQGEKSESVYFIRSNGVMVSPVAGNASFDKKVNERVTDLLEGSFFGERSILFDQISEYTYTAAPLNNQEQKQE